MDESTQKTVEKIQTRIQLRDQQNLADKKLVNSLCEIDGDPLIYTDLAAQETTINAPVRADQFYGKPMATVVRGILERRGQQMGAIPLTDLFQIMKSGGYDFENKDEQIAKRNVAITIGKNPAFLKVPNSGHIGLAEWYPNAKKEKKPSAVSNVTTITTSTATNGGLALEPESEQPDLAAPSLAAVSKE